MRIGFAGLATSHPFTDARTVLARDSRCEFVVWDADPVRVGEFCEEHPHTVRTGSIEQLVVHRPDAVIVTTPPPGVATAVGVVLDAGIPVMVNKPAAVTAVQLARLDDVVRGRERLFLTSSVLRFAPAIEALGELDRADLLSARVTVRHDVSWWIGGSSSWQDAADIGGGAGAVMGVHGFDLLDAVVGPGFEVRWVRGSKRHLTALTGPDVVVVGVEWPDGLAAVVEVLGRSDIEGYELALETAAGSRAVNLPAGEHDPFGYHGALDALLKMGGGAHSPLDWHRSRSVLVAVAAAREGSRQWD